MLTLLHSTSRDAHQILHSKCTQRLETVNLSLELDVACNAQSILYRLLVQNHALYSHESSKRHRNTDKTTKYSTAHAHNVSICHAASLCKNGPKGWRSCLACRLLCAQETLYYTRVPTSPHIRCGLREITLHTSLLKFLSKMQM